MTESRVSTVLSHGLGRAQGKCDIGVNMIGDPKVGNCAPWGKEMEQGTSTNTRMGRVLREREEDTPRSPEAGSSSGKCGECSGHRSKRGRRLEAVPITTGCPPSICSARFAHSWTQPCDPVLAPDASRGAETAACPLLKGTRSSGICPMLSPLLLHPTSDVSLWNRGSSRLPTMR